MGRKRTVNLNLPVRMKARVRPSGTYYYYFDGAHELPLGRDYVEAVRKWAELESGNAERGISTTITFRYVAEKYMIKVLPTKAPRTQKDNLIELANLYKFFDNPPAPLAAIEPHMIALYRDWRKVTRSTQEIALFSAIWNWGREQGYTSKPNPTIGVKRNRAKGRDVYIIDEYYCLLWWYATDPVRDAMDLAYLCGQRSADTLKMSESHIQDAEISIRQGKTNKRLRISVIGGLSAVLERIKARKKKFKVRSLALIVNEEGQALTASALDGRWEHIRANAAKHMEQAGFPEDAAEIRKIQFRDIRAKAGTDKDERAGAQAAQELLGHGDAKMTAHYIRHRRGKLITPTM